jgi:sulfopyruvate decarboxylase alpha subunit
MSATNIDWQNQLFEAFQRYDIRQVAYVPDAGHARLIEQCQNSNAIRSVVLTTEEEGIALLAGAWLGGQRGALLLQSSGVGNTINMLSLARSCRLPLLLLITMRGEWGEFNPWQIPMGQATPDVLEAMGVTLFPVERPEDVAPTIEAAARMAFEGPTAVAVLLRQRLIGAKSFATE